jgi:hypothetical protein
MGGDWHSFGLESGESHRWMWSDIGQPSIGKGFGWRAAAKPLLRSGKAMSIHNDENIS